MHCSRVQGSPSPAIRPGPAHGSRLGLSLGKAFPKQHPKAWWAREVQIGMLICPHQQKERGCQLLLGGQDAVGSRLGFLERRRPLSRASLLPCTCQEGSRGRVPGDKGASCCWLRPQAWAPGLAGSRTFLDLSLAFQESRNHLCLPALQRAGVCRVMENHRVK